MTLRRTLLAATALGVCTAMTTVQAGDRPMYFTVGGGANWLDEQSARSTAATAYAEFFGMNASSDTGFVVNAAIGAHLDNLIPGLRVELEASYRQNSAEGVWGSSTARASMRSVGHLEFDESTWAVLANAWYDIDLGKLRPYLGGGAGWAQTKLDGDYFRLFPSRPIDFSGDGFAWQLGVGINFDISPDMTVGIGYRYFSGPDVNVLPPNTNNHADGGSIEVTNQSVMLDLSFKL